MDELFAAVYEKIFTDDEPLDAFLFLAEEQFNGVSLADKTILEIGCGSGALSLS